MDKKSILQDDSAGRERTDNIDRLKERFRDQGLKGFNSREAIELLLALTGTDDNPGHIAERLEKDFGSICEVIDADASKISSTGRKGPGDDCMALMGLIKGLTRAYGQEHVPAQAVIKTKQDVLYHVNKAVPCKRGEKLLAIYLNSKNEVLGTWVLHDGPVTPETVTPRRAIEGALRHNGQGLIFVHRHNRPSAEPTKREARLIKGLWEAASAVDLIVHDHLIFSRLSLYSALEHGLISVPAEHQSRAAAPPSGSFLLKST